MASEQAEMWRIGVKGTKNEVKDMKTNQVGAQEEKGHG